MTDDLPVTICNTPAGKPARTASSPSANGATVTLSGAYVFYAAPQNNLHDTFTYTISDGHGGTANNTVSIKVLSPGGVARSVTVTNGLVTVKFFGIPGVQYDVQRASSPAASYEEWETVSVSPFTPTADGSFVYQGSAPNGAWFFRSKQH